MLHNIFIGSHKSLTSGLYISPTQKFSTKFRRQDLTQSSRKMVGKTLFFLGLRGEAIFNLRTTYFIWDDTIILLIWDWILKFLIHVLILLNLLLENILRKIIGHGNNRKVNKLHTGNVINSVVPYSIYGYWISLEMSSWTSQKWEVIERF
jgi:hypothetical protein